MHLAFDKIRNLVYVRNRLGQLARFTDLTELVPHSDQIIDFKLPFDPPPPIFSLEDQRKGKPKKEKKEKGISLLLRKNPELLRLAVELIKREEQADGNNQV